MHNHRIKNHTNTKIHTDAGTRTQTNSSRLKSIPLSIPHQKMWKIIIYARRTVESGLSLSLSVCVWGISQWRNCSSSTVKYDRHNRQQAHRMVNAFDANSFVVTMVVAVSVWTYYIAAVWWTIWCYEMNDDNQIAYKYSTTIFKPEEMKTSICSLVV